jgi:hypothetical protein
MVWLRRALIRIALRRTSKLGTAASNEPCSIDWQISEEFSSLAFALERAVR